MATILKKCNCAAGAKKGREGRSERMKKWHRCNHSWRVMWRSNEKQNAESFTTWAEADAKKKKIEAALATGERSKTVAISGGDISFEKYAEERLDKWPGAASSARTYRSSLRCYAYDRIGHKKIRDITREDITDIVVDLKNTKDSAGRPAYSSSTVAGLYVAIAAIFRQARLSKRVLESPCVDVDLPAVVSAAILIDPPEEQFLKFVNRFPADWRLPTWTQHGCGLRIGEALALNDKYFLNGGKTYRVMEQVDPYGEVIPCKWRREGEFRDVPVPDYVWEQYKRHVFFFPPDEDGYVIPGRKHRRVIRNSYLAHFRAGVELAGLPDFMTSHYWRHRWASVMLAKGIDITHVSRWLGHRQIETTYRVYGHMMPGVAEDARAAMDAAVFGGGAGVSGGVLVSS